MTDEQTEAIALALGYVFEWYPPLLGTVVIQRRGETSYYVATPWSPEAFGTVRTACACFAAKGTDAARIVSPLLDSIPAGSELVLQRRRDRQIRISMRTDLVGVAQWPESADPDLLARAYLGMRAGLGQQEAGP